MNDTEKVGSITISYEGISFKNFLTRKSKLIPWGNYLGWCTVDKQRKLYYEEQGSVRSRSISSDRKLESVLGLYYREWSFRGIFLFLPIYPFG